MMVVEEVKFVRGVEHILKKTQKVEETSVNIYNNEAVSALLGNSSEVLLRKGIFIR